MYLVLAVVYNVYKFIKNRRGSEDNSTASTSSASSSTENTAVQPNPGSRYSNGRSSVLSGQLPTCDPNGGSVVSGLANVRPSISASQMSIASQRSSVAATVPASEFSLYTGGSVLRERVESNASYSGGFNQQPAIIAQAAQPRQVSSVTQVSVPAKEVKTEPQAEQPRQLQRQRLQSLDTFRG